MKLVYSLIIILISNSVKVAHALKDWTTIETLAETHPYIVALLTNEMNYTCTGVILNHRAILTSGHCVFPEPIYVAVSTAAVRKTHTHNIFEIAFTRAHEDYTYEVNMNQYVTRMHSNIALVFTVKPVLLQFTESAILGKYFEAELKNKVLSVTGFGRLINTDLAVLQVQVYKQMACTNPDWYYCICGEEYTDDLTYDMPFGEGAPVFYGDEVVGITACPVGTLMKGDVDYNIFTVITSYLDWITKTQSETSQFHNKNIRSNDASMNQQTIYQSVLFVAIKLIILS